MAWTEEQKQFLITNYASLSYSTIAPIVSKNAGAVRAMALSLGLRKSKSISQDISCSPGNKFGRWTVVGFSRSVPDSKIVGGRTRKFFICKCECGAEKVVNGQNLLNGTSHSCGCYKLENSRVEKGHASYTFKYGAYQRCAKDRNLQFGLTFDEFVGLIIQGCFYCGSEPTPYNRYIKQKDRIISPDTVDRAWIAITGIDRRDSDTGYFPENCVPCCTNCNRIKADKAEADFLAHISKIYKFQELEKVSKI